MVSNQVLVPLVLLTICGLGYCASIHQTEEYRGWIAHKKDMKKYECKEPKPVVFPWTHFLPVEEFKDSIVTPEFSVIYKCDSGCAGCRKPDEVCTQKSQTRREEIIVFHWVKLSTSESKFEKVTVTHDTECECIGKEKKLIK